MAIALLGVFFWPSCTPGIILFFLFVLTLFSINITSLDITTYVDELIYTTLCLHHSWRQTTNPNFRDQSQSQSLPGRTVIYIITTETYSFLSSPLLPKKFQLDVVLLVESMYIYIYIFQCSVLRLGCLCIIVEGNNGHTLFCQVSTSMFFALEK